MSQEDLDILHESLKTIAKLPKQEPKVKPPVNERQEKQKTKSIEILNTCIFSNVLPHVGFIFQRGLFSICLVVQCAEYTPSFEFIVSIFTNGLFLDEHMLFFWSSYVQLLCSQIVPVKSLNKT